MPDSVKAVISDACSRERDHSWTNFHHYIICLGLNVLKLLFIESTRKRIES